MSVLLRGKNSRPVGRQPNRTQPRDRAGQHRSPGMSLFTVVSFLHGILVSPTVALPVRGYKQWLESIGPRFAYLLNRSGLTEYGKANTSYARRTSNRASQY